MRPMKKERGKHNRKKYVVKIHEVTDTDFVLSTSFATYRVPRDHSHWFKNAGQKVLQNVVCCGYETTQYGKVLSTFYWYDLDSIWDTDDFKKYEITDG